MQPDSFPSELLGRPVYVRTYCLSIDLASVLGRLVWRAAVLDCSEAPGVLLGVLEVGLSDRVCAFFSIVLGLVLAFWVLQLQ